MKYTIIVAALVVLTTGCTSIRSTMLNRTEDGSLVGNSNGEPKEFGQPRPFRGIPIKLKVPTHVDVRVIETYYMYKDAEDHLQQLRTQYRNLSVDTEFVYTEKVFTVDFKRPLSGTLEYGATFDENQYFATIKTHLEDTTIKDVASLIAAAAPLLGKKTAAVAGQKFNDQVIVNTRTIAYQRFDIDACGFEDEMRAFLNHYVNDCHTCLSHRGMVLEAPDGPTLFSPGGMGTAPASPPMPTPVGPSGMRLPPIEPPPLSGQSVPPSGPNTAAFREPR